MEGQDIARLKEPRLEDEHVCCLKTCLLEEGVVRAWLSEGQVKEVTW